MRKYTIFLSAGEPSGDFLGSQLMKALKVQLGKGVTFSGVGGPLMATQGLSSLFPIEELSIMGLAEIIPHIRRIKKRIRQTVDAIESLQPDIVVTIDAPGFNFRVGKALKKRVPSCRLVHYVAPSVWAWRPGRARKIAQFLDHLLVLFPFEPPYFLKEGLATTFVGHPAVEETVVKDPTFRTRHKIAANAPLLTLLPGSRRGEITRLLPLFQETVVRLQQTIPDIQVVIPTLPHLVAQIQKTYTLSATYVTTPLEKYAAFRDSQAALAASGTVTLELAAAGVPMIMGYKVQPVTCWLVRRMVTVKYACLINLLMDQEVVPEYLQNDCTPEKLAPALDVLFKEEAAGPSVKSMKKSMAQAMGNLHAPSPYSTPSECAAHQICQLLSS